VLSTGGRTGNSRSFRGSYTGQTFRKTFDIKKGFCRMYVMWKHFEIQPWKYCFFLSVGIGGSDNFSFSGDEIVGPSITVSTTYYYNNKF
jgi:hypothetical protein